MFWQKRSDSDVGSLQVHEVFRNLSTRRQNYSNGFSKRNESLESYTSTEQSVSPVVRMDQEETSRVIVSKCESFPSNGQLVPACREKSDALGMSVTFVESQLTMPI